MKTPSTILIFLFLMPFSLEAAGKTIPQIIAREPATMMDLGLLKLNSMLSNNSFAGLKSATIGATYNNQRGTIDIKVSNPVNKASKNECIKAIKATKRIFVRTLGTKKLVSLHPYFKHEGSHYKNKINWKKLPRSVVVTAIVLTKSNYQHSVYCQSKLMSKKISF